MVAVVTGFRNLYTSKPANQEAQFTLTDDSRQVTVVVSGVIPAGTLTIPTLRQLGKVRVKWSSYTLVDAEIVHLYYLNAWQQNGSTELPALQTEAATETEPGVFWFQVNIRVPLAGGAYLGIPAGSTVTFQPDPALTQGTYTDLSISLATSAADGPLNPIADTFQILGDFFLTEPGGFVNKTLSPYDYCWGLVPTTANYVGIGAIQYRDDDANIYMTNPPYLFPIYNAGASIRNGVLTPESPNAWVLTENPYLNPKLSQVGVQGAAGAPQERVDIFEARFMPSQASIENAKSGMFNRVGFGG